jgi:hypothetical protein
VVVVNKTQWSSEASLGLAALVVVGLTLIAADAHAGVPGLSLGSAGLSLGGGLGGGALGQLKSFIQGNMATLASIAVLGIGLVMAFAKSSWMELLAGVAFLATVGIVVTWASANTGSFFGSGALL